MRLLMMHNINVSFLLYEIILANLYYSLYVYNYSFENTSFHPRISDFVLFSMIIFQNFQWKYCDLYERSFL